MDLYGSVIETETPVTYIIMYGIVMVEWSRDDSAVPGGKPIRRDSAFEHEDLARALRSGARSPRPDRFEPTSA